MEKEPCADRIILMRPSQGFLGKGVYISGEQGNKGQIFGGNRGTKTILGNRGHRKTNFLFFGYRGTSQFISGEQGSRYPPPPPGRASLIRVFFFSMACSESSRSGIIGLRLNFAEQSVLYVSYFLPRTSIPSLDKPQELEVLSLYRF